MGKIQVTSEIGKLKKVLLHRPGNELLNLTPDTLSRLLFGIHTSPSIKVSLIIHLFKVE